MEGKFDGLYALFWTPERAQFLAFPKGAESGTNTVRLRQASFYLAMFPLTVVECETACFH
jgi:hypothetical protein